MDHNIGMKIDGRYEITELIGIGGMADVYKATDIMEDKIVAVKILKTEFAGNEDFQRRFRNESKAIAVLSHPNIVKIFDVGFTDKIQYIVMEFIDGITLKEFMEQQSVLKWKDAIHFTIQILRALQHAHDRGIVHRDIKPQNIMLFPDGTIKVMDFGIARFSREEGKTLSDKTIGSVHYISPEQARGDITDEKSDIYSVGAVLYEMLTGQKPFEADTPVAVALMHMQETAKNPRDINESIPEGLEEVILHAMQKDTQKRYQSASEMIKDLDSFKTNPAIVFGYNNKMLDNDEAGSTIFFNSISKANVDVKDNEEDEDEEEEEEERTSLLVPVLTGVTVGVVVIAAIIICIILINGFKSKEKENLTIPNYVGILYDEAKNSDEGRFKFEADQAYSDEYSEGYIIEQNPAEGQIVKKGSTIKVIVSKGVRMVEVPDVVNKSYDYAVAKLTEAGFEPIHAYAPDDEITEGYVVKTNPEAGTKAEYGSEISVYESQGPVSTLVSVPKVTGLTQAEAEKTIRNAKLIPNVQTKNSTQPAGTVISQLPLEFEKANRNDTVTIFVSTGELVNTEVVINVPIPKDAKGGYVLTGYVEGNPVGTQSIAKAELVDNTVKLKVTSQGIKTVKVEVKSTEYPNNGSVYYADFDVDFVEGEVLPPRIVNPDAFTEVSTPDEPLVSPTVPTIKTDLPETKTASVGEKITLSIVAEGNGTLSYQWYKGTSEIAGATSSSLKMTVETTDDAGSYMVVVTNELDGETKMASSSTCDLTVNEE